MVVPGFFRTGWYILRYIGNVGLVQLTLYLDLTLFLSVAAILFGCNGVNWKRIFCLLVELGWGTWGCRKALSSNGCHLNLFAICDEYFMLLFFKCFFFLASFLLWTEHYYFLYWRILRTMFSKKMHLHAYLVQLRSKDGLMPVQSNWLRG